MCFWGVSGDYCVYLAFIFTFIENTLRNIRIAFIIVVSLTYQKQPRIRCCYLIILFSTFFNIFIMENAKAKYTAEIGCDYFTAISPLIVAQLKELNAHFEEDRQNRGNQYCQVRTRALRNMRDAIKSDEIPFGLKRFAFAEDLPGGKRNLVNTVNISPFTFGVATKSGILGEIDYRECMYNISDTDFQYHFFKFHGLEVFNLSHVIYFILTDAAAHPHVYAEKLREEFFLPYYNRYKCIICPQFNSIKLISGKVVPIPRKDY